MSTMLDLQSAPPVTPTPGPTTTEFWQTLLTNALAAVVSIITLFGAHFDLTGLTALVPSIAILAAAIVTGLYSHSRAMVKSAALTAPATIQSSKS